jgi:preprotein translocase subunit SecD
MNKFSWWKATVIGLAFVFGIIYTIPNFYGQSPAVQISATTESSAVPLEQQTSIFQALKQQNIPIRSAHSDERGFELIFDNNDIQIKARDVIDQELNPPNQPRLYVVALNLVPNEPKWLANLGAMPMYLGLDLAGGVHFLLQVDIDSALQHRQSTITQDIRNQLREQQIYYDSINLDSKHWEILFHDAGAQDKAQKWIEENDHDLVVQSSDSSGLLILHFKPEFLTAFRDQTVKQNMVALRNRVNELGAKEPLIQQQGEDRIVVELPGIQDTAKAKDIIGRTAILEVHLVDEEHPDPVTSNVTPPLGDLWVAERGHSGVFVKKNIVVTGENITDAGAGFDTQSNRPTVNVSLDSAGARIMRQTTRDNLKKRMAILMIEKNDIEAINVSTIQDEFGARFQITGLKSPKEANELALLLRAGALAAPMDFIEERTVGPSLGAENIARGFHSTWVGFTAIALFMIFYYAVFGLISVLSLAFNVMLLVGLLSLLQATLTLPGMAGIALTVGMAIDANVLINERIREELRLGSSPLAAIQAGYDRAFGTILDSNVTTGIAGVALFAFGSGPIKGFAVVLVLGILTSMFSAIWVSRILVHLVYGRRKRIGKLLIGYVYTPKKVEGK